MNKQHDQLRWGLFLLALTYGFLPLSAQLELSVNRAEAIYNVGETAFFQAAATYTGSATYEIIYDNEAPVITSGTVQLQGGQTVGIPYNHNEPGLVICRVNFNGVVKEASAAFAPLEISPLEEEPGDFDSFWASQKNLKNSLPIDPQISYLSENGNQTTYTFSLSNIEGRRTYGYISVPKGSGPFPASISLPPYGSSNAVVGADTESAEKGGMIAVSLSIHNSPVNQDDPNAYVPDDNSDKEQFYYRYALIGAMHVIDYLQTRPDFDGNVCAMGVSQGGGLAIMLAGIDNRVSLLINSNPTMGQHVGYKYDRASGFPYYLSIADDNNQGNMSAFNQVVNATKYYDAMFHARRFNGASYTLTGFKDLVVPSATALVSHNQLPGSKVLMISRDGGHNHPNEYWNGRFEFMRRHFLGANNPPFQFGSTNKGFFADAGTDQSVGTSANLNGEVFFDDQQLTNLSVYWRKVSGPGTVSFSNTNSYNTTANFSSNGTYVLQFVAQDNRKLDGEGKIYFISDDMTVTATGGGNPVYTLNLSCPGDQTIQIPSGQSQIPVNWNDPTATSNCPSGASYFQLAGPTKGSSFAEGSYFISYRATDNCGNQEDCNFTITVSQDITSSNITLNCPSDIEIDAAPGDNAVTVSWADPTATTTCPTGGTGSGDCSSTFKSGFSYMGTFDNSQFYISNNALNWNDAKVAAENAGGNLAIINDAQENDFIQQNINNEIVFIGLSDNIQEGSIRWVDGSTLGYNNFVSNPNNSGGNDYITLYPWNGQWDFNNQFVVKKYVLEIACSGGSSGNGLTITQTGGGANGSNFSIGTTLVSYSATDDCGNSTTCSFNVTVNSSATNLSINCPSDQSVQIPAGQNSTTVTWAPATASSNCSGGATITQISGNGNGNQFTAGNYTITYQATDNCGNSQTCSFNITVTNTPTDLTINCPANQTFQIPAGQSQTQVNWSLPSANTSCPNGANVSQTSGPSPFSQLGVGNYTVSYQATDNCGNSQTCSFTLSVTNTSTNLTLNCPSNQTFQIPAGQTQTQVNWSAPTANTNCPNGANISQTSGPSPISQLGIGNYTVSYQATDNCGNSQTCSFIITVAQSATNLSISCPANFDLELPQGQTEAPLTWTEPTASSNCSGSASVNQIGGAPKFSVLGIGAYTISYEATDNCGNRETCSFIVNVTPFSGTGNSDISLSCPNDIVVEIPFGQNSSPVSWSTPNATTTCTTGGGSGNDCNGTFISGYSFLGEFEGSQYYKSNSPLSFPLAQTAAENAGGALVKITSAAENEFIRSNIGSDLCIIGLSDAQSEGTWRWTDGTIASYLNFPGSVNNNDSNDFGVINFWNGEWELTTDFIYKKYILEISCGGGSGGPGSVNVSQTGGPSSGSNFGIGTTTISYQATDDCGNVENCSFNVTINQAPPIGNDNPPTVVISTANNVVTDDFTVNIVFNEPVTGLDIFDLSISNANWYGFAAQSSTNYSVIVDPTNAGNVTIQVPGSVAFDSAIQGNVASNILVVTYELDDDPVDPPTNSSCLVKPSTVIMENGATVGGSVNNIINGTGLSAEDDLNAVHGGLSLYDGVWLNDGTDVTLRFDLGQAQTIDGIALWNYTYHTWKVLKRRGVRDFQISTSTDGINFSATNFFSAGQTTARGEEEEIQRFGFVPVTARYVKMRIINAIDDSFYVGLGEVRFTKNCAMSSSNARVESGSTSNIFQSQLVENQQEKSQANIFPNPTRGRFYLSLSNNEYTDARIIVVNEVGAIIQDLKVNSQNQEALEINLDQQADGLYFIKILIDNELPILKKLIKTNAY